MANDAFSKAQGILSSHVEPGRAGRGLLPTRIVAGPGSGDCPKPRSSWNDPWNMSRSSSNDYQSIRTEIATQPGGPRRGGQQSRQDDRSSRRSQSRAIGHNVDAGGQRLDRPRLYTAGAGRIRRYALVPATGSRFCTPGQVTSNGRTFARLALGSSHTQEGRFDEAVSHLEAALKFLQPAGYRRSNIQRPDSAWTSVSR